MRDIYLIDFENVASDGLSGITNLSPEDQVVIFYSTNSNRLTMKMHILIGKSNCSFVYFETAVGGRNALDHQISTWLGYLIGTGAAERNYYIVSRDTGYKYITSFWSERDQKPNVICVDSIRSAARMEQRRQEREAENEQKVVAEPEIKPEPAPAPQPELSEAQSVPQPEPQEPPASAEPEQPGPQPVQEEKPVLQPEREEKSASRKERTRKAGARKSQEKSRQAQDKGQENRLPKKEDSGRRADIAALIAPYPMLQEQHLQQLIADSQKQKLCNHLRKHLGQEKGLALYNEIKRRAWH